MKCLIPLVILFGFTLSVDFALSQDSTRTESDGITQTHKISQRDDWLGKDKFDHAIVSAGLVAAQFYFLHTEQNWERSKSRQLAASSTFIIGFAKEIYDGVSHRGTASWKDLLADIVGIGLAFAVVIQ